MVCMSAPSIPRIIDGVVNNYNAEVIAWTDDLKKHFEICVWCCNINNYRCFEQLRANSGSVFTLTWDDTFDEDDIGYDISDESDVESCSSDASSEWECFDDIDTLMTVARMH